MTVRWDDYETELSRGRTVAPRRRSGFQFARVTPEEAARVSPKEWQRISRERCPSCGQSVGRHELHGAEGKNPYAVCPGGGWTPDEFEQKVLRYYDVGFTRPAGLGESGRGGARARPWHEGTGLSPRTVKWIREFEDYETRQGGMERQWHRDQQARYEAALDAEVKARREWESIAGYGNRVERGQPGYAEWKAREVAARDRWDEAKTRTAVASRAPGVKKKRR